VLARLTKTLGADWTGTLTASVFDSGSITVGNYPAINPNSNPFNSANQIDFGPGFARVIVVPPITVPVGNPMNPTNQPLYPVGRLFESNLTSTDFATDTYRVFADFAGPLGGWDFDVNLGEMYALTTQTYNGVRDYAALQSALNNGYVFGTGGPAYAAVSPTISSTMSNSLQVADIHATRELFTLPGGPLSFAVGAGYYHNYLDAIQSPQAVSGQYSGINLAYAFGGLTDFNGYGEIVAPITKQLEVDISGRYDHYNTVGGAAVPKLGLKFTPIQQVTFRGTWGEGFRAPNPAETANSGSAFLFNRSADAYLCPSSGPANPATGFLNPPVTPMAGDVASFCSFSPVYEQGTNPHLKPETSTNFTAGFIVKPIPQVNLSVDYWSIDIKDLVLTSSLFPELPFPPAPLTPTRSGPTMEPVLQANGTTVSTLEPMGEPVYTQSGYVNAGEIAVNGIDVDLATHFDFGSLGRLSAQLNLSHELTWVASSCYGGQCTSVELAGTHGPSGVSGDTANPKTRAAFTLSWDRGPLDVTVTVNYVGGYSLNDPSLGESNCADAVNDYSGKFSLGQDSNGNPVLPTNFPTQYCRVPSFTYVNLYSQYQFGEKLTVFGSVVNLFNTAPPVDLVTYGAGLLNYNAALAQAGAVGALFDVGFKYRF